MIIAVYGGGYSHSRLLQHLIRWQIDLDAVDSTGLTALHYAYLFQQEECAKFLNHSGVDQFILEDLGRSPSDLDPSLEVRIRSVVDVDSDGSADGAPPIEYDTTMPDEAGKHYAKHFFIRQWILQGEIRSVDLVDQSSDTASKEMVLFTTVLTLRSTKPNDQRMQQIYIPVNWLHGSAQKYKTPLKPRIE